jgi:hypothetical protein
VTLLLVRVETLSAGADAVELREFRKKLRTHEIGNEGTAGLAGSDRDITIPFGGELVAAVPIPPFGGELVPDWELVVVIPIPLPENAGRRMAVDDE